MGEDQGYIHQLSVEKMNDIRNKSNAGMWKLLMIYNLLRNTKGHLTVGKVRHVRHSDIFRSADVAAAERVPKAVVDQDLADLASRGRGNMRRESSIYFALKLMRRKEAVEEGESSQH
ncbi:hypothetical protein AAG570_000484 [Ranatra chinensis]|uniref:Uncharacterized protein n=1 Tax=Ranatra chinensis TaxID=642074 RepID=A0ABD0YZA4_9HEMI